MEDLHHLLSTAFIQSSYKEAKEKLLKFDNEISWTSNPIDSIVLKFTRKILLKFGNSLYDILPRLYIKYLKIVDKSNTNLLISLCNDALLMKENLTGSEICEQLEICVREALVFLIQQGTLDSEQSQIVQQLLEIKATINYDEQLQYALEELETNSSVGLHILIDLFSTMSSVKDQFYYYSTHLSPFIKTLKTEKSIEIYNITLRFMDIFLSPTRFLIKINDNLLEYQLSSLKYFEIYEDVFYTSVSLLKILLQADVHINENSVRIIYKLWNLYPKLRNHLYELILVNFKTISRSKSLEPRKKGAEFLYLIMHDKNVDGDFKEKLENEELGSLFGDEGYVYTELAPVELKDTKVTTGYPIYYEINPGEKYSHFVEIEEPNSILSWGFAIEENDISYKISRMNPVEKIIHKGDRCNCFEVPIHGIEFIQQPGLYKFE